MGQDAHRGFGFVDFFSSADAKVCSIFCVLLNHQSILTLHNDHTFIRFQKAMAGLHHTHLSGRRLVLEWAAAEDDVEDLRKRTADHFAAGGEPAEKRSRKSVFDASGAIADAEADEKMGGGGGDDDEYE